MTHRIKLVIYNHWIVQFLKVRHQTIRNKLLSQKKKNFFVRRQLKGPQEAKTIKDFKNYQIFTFFVILGPLNPLLDFFFIFFMKNIYFSEEIGTNILKIG